MTQRGTGIAGMVGWLYQGPLREWAPSVLLAAGAIVLWEVLVRAFEVQRWLLPAPSVILNELYVSRGILLDHGATTFTEVILGFGLSALAGILLAAAIASSRLLERSIYPFIIASQTIPYIAIAPLLLVWVGPEITSKVIVVALISFFPIVVNLVDGLRSTDREMVNVLRTLGRDPHAVILQAPCSRSPAVPDVGTEGCGGRIGYRGCGGGVGWRAGRAGLADEGVGTTVPDAAGIRFDRGAVRDGDPALRATNRDRKVAVEELPARWRLIRACDLCQAAGSYRAPSPRAPTRDAPTGGCVRACLGEVGRYTSASRRGYRVSRYDGGRVVLSVFVPVTFMRWEVTA